MLQHTNAKVGMSAMSGVGIFVFKKACRERKAMITMKSTSEICWVLQYINGDPALSSLHLLIAVFDLQTSKVKSFRWMASNAFASSSAP